MARYRCAGLEPSLYLLSSASACGVAGRLFSLLAAGREFAFGKFVRFTLLRGVAFTLGAPAFALGRLTLAGLFVLPFAFLRFRLRFCFVVVASVCSRFRWLNLCCDSRARRALRFRVTRLLSSGD